MAKFSVKIVMDDGTVLDDVIAEFPDQVMPFMVSACEDLGHVNSDGSPIKAGRAVTYSLRWFLTNLVRDYAARAAAAQAQAQAASSVQELLSAIVIKEG